MILGFQGTVYFNTGSQIFFSAPVRGLKNVIRGKGVRKYFDHMTAAQVKKYLPVEI